MPITAPVPIPPLCDGDHLTRDEFLRRWEAMPDLHWAELIDGVFYAVSYLQYPRRFPFPSERLAVVLRSGYAGVRVTHRWR